jgi:hypothetical protein
LYLCILLSNTSTASWGHTHICDSHVYQEEVTRGKIKKTWRTFRLHTARARTHTNTQCCFWRSLAETVRADPTSFLAPCNVKAGYSLVQSLGRCLDSWGIVVLFPEESRYLSLPQNAQTSSGAYSFLFSRYLGISIGKKTFATWSWLLSTVRVNPFPHTWSRAQEQICCTAPRSCFMFGYEITARP